MALEFLKALFGRRLKLPRDQTTRLPRAVRKATEPQAAAIQAAIDEIAALPGLADVALTKRVPRGFYAASERLFAAYDAYVEAVAKHMNLETAPRAGTPEGTNACMEQPVGVTGLEGLSIYRKARPWREFPQVAQELARQGEAQFKEIQDRHTGKDPEKIAMTSDAVQQGRLAFARRGELCPFLDRDEGRCKIWSVRPNVCRMHFIRTDPAWSDPRHEFFNKVKATNIRMPLRQQLALLQIEKRMLLNVAPFLPANVLQLAQFAEGQTIAESGEVPTKFGPDGAPPAKANRNRPNAKKFQKEREKDRRRAKK